MAELPVSAVSASDLPRSDRAFFVFAGVFSAAALGFLAYLLLFNQTRFGEWDLRFMPAVNATLNSIAAVLLASALWAVKTGRRTLHGYLNVTAFATSALFLVGYVAYHAVHGDTKFQGTGAIRGIYFFILITHILLSTALLPMVLTTFYFAARRSFARHRRLARWTWPVWMYVSITGVAIFFMLRSAAPRM
jgi:putative membrane protein